MAWSSHGDAVCDSCSKVKLCHQDRHRAVQMLRAAGWHHAQGETIGGVSYEAILCGTCGHEEHKRPKRIPLADQTEELPIDWGTRSTHESGPGITSR